jgi:hypothetical protein
MAITHIFTTDTFRIWFNKTNEIIDNLNVAVLGDGVIANGDFTANGSLRVIDTFKANSSEVLLSGNTVITANVVVTSNTDLVNFAPLQVVFNPLNGSLFNTDISVNAFSTFLFDVAINANVSIAGDLNALTGNAIFGGTVTINGNPVFLTSILFGAANAMINVATLTNPQYDDFGPAGLDGAQIVNLTPGIDTVLTGIQEPSALSAGGRVLYLQNLSASKKVTLAASNTSSGIFNRFKLPGDANYDMLPGTSVSLLYNTDTHQWRPLGSAGTTFNSLTVNGNSALGNVTISGWTNCLSTLQVAGLTALSGNASLAGFANVAGSLQVTGNTTLSANVAVTANGNFTGANTAITTLNIMGTANCQSRLIVPVGTNLWAT